MPPLVTDVSDLPGGFPCLSVGSGPPLVVFPGLARVPISSPLPYRGLAHATRRQVIVVDRPRTLARGVTMSELAAAHARGLETRFSEPIDLLGISTGGTIALQMAVDHPTLIRRLVVAASASWLGDRGRTALRAYGDAIANRRSGAHILASMLAPRWRAWLMVPMLRLSEWLERDIDSRVMLATIDAECGFDVTARLGSITAPVLVVGGGRDRAFPLELVRETAARIPHARLAVYPRAGHLGTLLHPRFGEDVSTFLNAL
jgi:pimeloyl-ACP methyl ester carboxylesterase